MNHICNKCKNNANNYCKLKKEVIEKLVKNCSNYKPLYSQESLFDAVGNSK